MIVEIWTDGACRNQQYPHLRQGGWGTMLYCPDLNMVKFFHGRSKEATNNEMELYSILVALQNLKSSQFQIKIFSDSQYAVGICSTWMHQWKAKNWRVNKANLDLVKQIYDEWMKFPFIEINHVDGHVGIYGNEIVDRLCNLAIDGHSYDIYAPCIKIMKNASAGIRMNFLENVGQVLPCDREDTVKRSVDN